MANEAVAKVERVSHRYGKTLALDNISLDIPAGEMIGMIGPDAAGKSTLLGLIAGVRIIQEGRVIVFDGNMADRAYRNSQIGRIAYMPQGLGSNLYPTLSVFENIDFHGRLFGLSHAQRKRHMDELLKATSLDPFVNRPVQSVGGGAAASWSLNNLGPRIIDRNFEPGFFVEHFIKDMGIALDEARRMNLALPGLALANQLYVAVQAQGYGRKGTHALMLALEHLSNVKR
jgi:ABC-type transport system involved in cytochrome c biogenesis ATPase subunit